MRAANIINEKETEERSAQKSFELLRYFLRHHFNRAERQISSSYGKTWKSIPYQCCWCCCCCFCILCFPLHDGRALKYTSCVIGAAPPVSHTYRLINNNDADAPPIVVCVCVWLNCAQHALPRYACHEQPQAIWNAANQTYLIFNSNGSLISTPNEQYTVQFSTRLRWNGKWWAPIVITICVCVLTSAALSAHTSWLHWRI